MATQAHLDWKIHEVERAHNKHPETAFAWASKFNDACMVFSTKFLFLRAIVFSARISHICKIKHQLSCLGVLGDCILSDRDRGLC